VQLKSKSRFLVSDDIIEFSFKTEDLTMKRAFLLLAVLLNLSAFAEVKISQLPLLTGSAVGSTDSFPFVSVSNSETAQLQISQLFSVPSLQNPTFASLVTTGLVQVGTTLTAAQAAVGTSTVDPASFFYVSSALTTLTGATQHGVRSEPTFSSFATTHGSAISAHPSTQAASFTMPALYGVFSNVGTIGSGSTVTNWANYGGAEVTPGTNNAFLSDNSSFTGNWGINLSTTRANFLGGNLAVATILQLNSNATSAQTDQITGGSTSDILAIYGGAVSNGGGEIQLYGPAASHASAIELDSAGSKRIDYSVTNANTWTLFNGLIVSSGSFTAPGLAGIGSGGTNALADLTLSPSGNQTGTAQATLNLQGSYNTAATASMFDALFQTGIPSTSSTTFPFAARLDLTNYSVGAGSTLTNGAAIYSQDFSSATNNAILTDSSSWTGNYAVYLSTTNPNYLGGTLTENKYLEVGPSASGATNSATIAYFASAQAGPTVVNVTNSSSSASADAQFRVTSNTGFLYMEADSAAMDNIASIGTESGFTAFDIAAGGATPLNLVSNGSTGISLSSAGVVTIGAASTTHQHAINGLSAAASNCGSLAAECWEVTFDGTTHYIPVF
jgi:hypothetical protein